MVEVELIHGRAPARTLPGGSGRYDSQACAPESAGERKPVEQTARAAGALSPREVSAWGWLFRKILDQLATALGLGRRRRLAVEPDDPALGRSMPVISRLPESGRGERDGVRP
jgi:hypothetical protein